MCRCRGFNQSDFKAVLDLTSAAASAQKSFGTTKVSLFPRSIVYPATETLVTGFIMGPLPTNRRERLGLLEVF
jgi:hypothetical protein